MRTVLFNRLFLLVAVLMALTFTSSAFGQCGSCSCYPGYTYTNTSVDYDGESVVATGVTSGAYSSCGHTYGVTVQITSPDGRHISYDTGFGGSNYASGSAWMAMGGYDGDYFSLTYHKERCWISGAIFVSAVTQQVQPVDPQVKLKTLRWDPEEINHGESATLKVIFFATSGAAGIQINYSISQGTNYGSLPQINPATITAIQESKNLPGLLDTVITPTVTITDTSTQGQSNTYNNGTVNVNFAWSGPEMHNGKKVKYDGGSPQDKTLRVWSYPE